MPAAFPGYPSQAITWLRQIATHNDRAWFQDHRDVFEEHVKAPTEALVAALNGRLARFAPDYVTDPKRALTRIHRDLRFRKDKTPYNTYLAARFGYRELPRDACAAFWVQVSARGLELWGGLRGASTEVIDRVRVRLVEEHEAFEKLCARKALRDAMGELQGERLQRVPRGFNPLHPAADLLRQRAWYFHARLPVKLARSPAVVTEVARRFRLMTPFMTFINEAIDGRM
ncbi:MAG: DUF2461 domain-containing protein [Planctomycetota bacterium]|nr:DUF2461 domain-containing protein [Planctomycetota bacterium]